MALIRFGGGVVGMSGSIAGDTFARNRSGNYARARTKPVNVNSSGQQLVRSAVAYLAEYWQNTLSAAERAAWDLYASNVAMKNRLGESIYLTGFNHFIRSNSIPKRYGAAPTEPGPTNFTLAPADPTFALSISAAAQKLSITFDNTMAWANDVLGRFYIFMGKPQPATHMFFAGPWFYGGRMQGDAETPPESPAANLSCPFVATEGQKVWAYARIREGDGRLSEPFRASCTVGA